MRKRKEVKKLLLVVLTLSLLAACGPESRTDQATERGEELSQNNNQLKVEKGLIESHFFASPKIRKYIPMTYMDISNLAAKNTYWLMSRKSAYLILLGLAIFNAPQGILVLWRTKEPLLSRLPKRRRLYGPDRTP